MVEESLRGSISWSLYLHTCIYFFTSLDFYKRQYYKGNSAQIFIKYFLLLPFIHFNTCPTFLILQEGRNEQDLLKI